MTAYAKFTVGERVQGCPELGRENPAKQFGEVLAIEGTTLTIKWDYLAEPTREDVINVAALGDDHARLYGHDGT